MHAAVNFHPFDGDAGVAAFDRHVGSKAVTKDQDVQPNVTTAAVGWAERIDDGRAGRNRRDEQRVGLTGGSSHGNLTYPKRVGGDGDGGGDLGRADYYDITYRDAAVAGIDNSVGGEIRSGERCGEGSAGPA
jgi:hypothetical protein